MRHPDDAADRRAWSSAHGGLDPDASRWVSGWLTLVHRCARPLARRHVRPDLVSLAGIVVSAAVPAVILLGDAWAALAGVLAVVVGLLDGIDGAVARMDGSGSRRGRVVDALADRVSDVLLLAVPVMLGAPVALWVAAVVLTLLLEYARASASLAGAGPVVVVTPWERAGRIVLVATVGLLAAGVAVLEGLDVLPEGAVSLLAGPAAGVAVLLAAGSLLWLLAAAWRLLGVPSGGTDEVRDDAGGERHEGQPAPRVAGPADEEQPGHG